MSNISCQLILASRSPQRRQLLQQAGYDFRVVVPSNTAECGVCSRETPPQLVARLARQKAQDVAVPLDRGLVLGCDTVAECQGQVLGKPQNRQHAARMLQLLCGRDHRVYSGICLWRRPDNLTLLRVAVTHLHMESIVNDQIEQYLDSGAWQDKAGGFGYQDRLGWLRIVEGSESNVVGLPLEMLDSMLEEIAMLHD